MNDKVDIAYHVLNDVRRNLHSGLMTPGWVERNGSYVVTMLNVAAAGLAPAPDLQKRIELASRMAGGDMCHDALDEIDGVLRELETAKLVREL